MTSVRLIGGKKHGPYSPAMDGGPFAIVNTLAVSPMPALRLSGVRIRSVLPNLTLGVYLCARFATITAKDKEHLQQLIDQGTPN
jgi:hypothetical protein